MSPVWGIGGGVINLHVLSMVGDSPSSHGWVGGAGISSCVRGLSSVSETGRGSINLHVLFIKGW